MKTPTSRWLAIALIASLYSGDAATAVTAESADLILPPDPRFNVFELSNSAGDRTFSSPYGTVLLSFASRDLRYCRAARFPADRAIVLACREEAGWKIEATSSLSPQEATNPTAFGSGNINEIGVAVEALRASADFLNEAEIIEAAAKGWRDPVPVDEQALDARDILKRTAQVYMAARPYKESFLIRRVYEEGKAYNAATKTTWFYEPALNVPVEPGSLLFNKPTPQ